LAEGIDLLVTVGARLDDTTTANFSPLLQGDHTFIQIDHDLRRLGRSYSASFAVGCDLSLGLYGILKALQPITGSALQRRQENLRRMHAVPQRDPMLFSGQEHDPRAAVAALRRRFGPGTVFSCDIGNHLLFTAQELGVDEPDAFHVNLGLGGMGSGLGLAIGLQLGYGASRQVVAVVGDGTLLMVGNELATCANLQIPLVVALLNDGHLGMVQHGNERVFGRSQPFATPPVDYVAYARSLGAAAVQVENEMQLKRIGQRPTLLELPIDPRVQAHNPREATLNFPTRGG
jgi:acetolactate synthase-1/2/3 large subunit